MPKVEKPMTFYMNTKEVPETPVYEDKFPEGTTLEDLKKKVRLKKNLRSFN